MLTIFQMSPACRPPPMIANCIYIYQYFLRIHSARDVDADSLRFCTVQITSLRCCFFWDKTLLTSAFTRHMIAQVFALQTIGVRYFSRGFDDGGERKIQLFGTTTDITSASVIDLLSVNG
ncbi:hypothetical protein Plhal304r1_c019g0067141 [Plasmopara halstedii]